MPRLIVFPTPLDTQRHTVYEFEPGTTMRELMASTPIGELMRNAYMLPRRNGEFFLEADFDDPIGADELLALEAVPQGPAIKAVGLFIAKNWLVISTIATAALTVYGLVAVPSIDESAFGQTSPNHSLSVRSNQARLGQPKPVQYGRVRSFPDLSAQPYTEFDANDEQTVWLLYEVSQGEVAIDTSSFKFEETPLSDFDNAVSEVILPGNRSNLFTNVTTTLTAVNNVPLENTQLGPYTVNASGTEISAVSFDITAPGGLYRSRSSGKRERKSVQFQFEAREIDNGGAPVGSWVVLAAPWLAGQSTDQIRRTYRYQLTRGRYEVRITRLTPDSTGEKISDTLELAQVRGYFADPLPITDTTRVAVRIRGSAQIGSRALTKFSCVGTRKLEIWNGSTWSAPTETRSAIWAFCDACRATYGGQLADAFINLVDMLALDTEAAGLGLKCDGIFDTAGTLWPALQRIAATIDAVPIDEAGVYTMVRDIQQSAPTQMFNMRNAALDTFSLDQKTVVEETADHVEIEFYDENQDYRLVKLPCPLPTGSNTKPKTVRVWGIVEPDKAGRMGLRLGAVNRYRREAVTWESGLEGRIPRWGEQVHLSHYVLSEAGFEQQSGDILDFRNGDEILLSEGAVPANIPNPWIRIPSLDGSPAGPYAVTDLGGGWVRLAGTLDTSGLLFDPKYDNPRYTMGESTAMGELVKVDKVLPQGNGRIRIEGYVDDPSVYSVTAGGPPIPPVLPDLQAFLPSVTKLTFRLGGSNDDPDVYLSWEGDNADRYDIEYSEDGGVTWIDAGDDVVTPGYIDEPEYRGTDLRYRVAGVNVFRGPWAEIAIDIQNGTYTQPGIVDASSASLVNQMHHGWGSFEELLGTGSPQISVGGSVAFVDSAAEAFVGRVIVQVTGSSVGGGWLTNYSTTPGAPIRIPAQRRWVVRVRARSPAGDRDFRLFMRASTDGGTSEVAVQDPARVNTTIGSAAMAAYAWEIDYRGQAADLTFARLQFYSNSTVAGNQLGNGEDVYFDGLELFDVTEFPFVTAANIDTFAPGYVPVSEGGPQGNQGDPGAQGDPGDDGPPGVDGLTLSLQPTLTDEWIETSPGVFDPAATSQDLVITGRAQSGNDVLTYQINRAANGTLTAVLQGSSNANLNPAFAGVGTRRLTVTVVYTRDGKAITDTITITTKRDGVDGADGDEGLDLSIQPTIKTWLQAPNGTWDSPLTTSDVVITGRSTSGTDIETYRVTRSALGILTWAPLSGDSDLTVTIEGTGNVLTFTAVYTKDGKTMTRVETVEALRAGADGQSEMAEFHPVMATVGGSATALHVYRGQTVQITVDASATGVNPGTPPGGKNLRVRRNGVIINTRSIVAIHQPGEPGFPDEWYGSIIPQRYTFTDSPGVPIGNTVTYQLEWDGSDFLTAPYFETYEKYSS